MGRLIGARGWPGVVSVRVAAVVGMVCVTALAVAAPAMADDNPDGRSSDRPAADRAVSERAISERAISERAVSDGASSDRASSQGASPATYKSTPCTATARACVDLAKQQAWLIDPQGKIIRGPVPISSGGPGQETPIGTFKVQWKNKNHRSTEYKDEHGQGVPMPYSVFFADGGVAFHGGSLRRASGGCVHLDDPDAQAFYDTLKLGDEVQVH